MKPDRTFLKNLSKHPILTTLVVLLAFIIVTFPAYKALRHHGYISGHDSDGHIFRLIEFDRALHDGHFPVRWAKDLDFGLGMPFFNFNYPFSYYLPEFFHLIGFDFASALKLVYAITFPLSGFFAYLWLKPSFGKKSAFLGGLLYTLVPYHFVNVYVRSALGEAVAGMFVPLVFYAIDRVFDKSTWRSVAFLSLSYSLLLLSHNITALVFSLIWFFYIGLRWWKEKRLDVLKKLITGFGLSIGLGSYFLIPAFFYKQFTHLDSFQAFFKDNINNLYPDFQTLIYSPWGFGGPKVGIPSGEMSFQLGILQIMVLLMGPIFIAKEWKKKKFEKKWLGFFLVLFAISIFLILSVSIPVWRYLPFMGFIQFPWRLLMIPPLCAAFCGAFLFSQLKRMNSRIVYAGFLIVMVLLVVQNSHFWNVERYLYWDKWLTTQSYPGTLTLTLEQVPKWHSITNENVPYSTSAVLAGNAQVLSQDHTTNYHRFVVDATESAIIADRTDYFPGWNVYDNGNRLALLSPYDQKSRGMIAFAIAPGVHLIESKLEETTLEKTADMVSILFGIVILGLFLAPINLKRSGTLTKKT